jgi:arylformamidase
MYDLYPVSLSARNLYVNFHLDDTINKLSPIHHIQHIRFPVVLSHGTKETPEFQQHTKDFAAALEAAGKDVKLIVAQGYNHFEHNETFANPFGPLGRASLELMGLQPGGALIWGQRPR